MNRSLLSMLAVFAAVAVSWYGLTEVWAFTTASVSSGAGGYRTVALPAVGSANPNPRPYVYCEAPAQSVVRPNAANQTTSVNIVVTCYNAFGHSMANTVAYTTSPTTGQVPSWSPASPLSCNATAGSSCTATLTAGVRKNTNAGPYTITYTVSASSAGVTATFTFSSTLTVT